MILFWKGRVFFKDNNYTKKEDNMKYNNKIKRLAKRQENFDNLDPSDKKGRRRAGSYKKCRDEK